MFNKIVEGELNLTMANKIMKPTNLNADATDVALDIAFDKRDIASNHSQEENFDAYFRNKELVDATPSLDFPNFVVSNRKSIF